MRHVFHIAFTVAAAGVLLCVGCLPQATQPGGSAGTGGPGGARTGGVTGGGTGGAMLGGAGTMGTATGGTVGQGGTIATGGSAAGTDGRAGGSPGGTGGGGGAAASGGASPRDAGSGGGSGGVSSSDAGAAAGAGGAVVVAGDDFVSDVKIAVHPQTTTILVVTWTQLKAADSTALDFSFTGAGTMTSHGKPGATGAHQDVVLGAPEKTEVTLHIVSRSGGVDYKTKDYKGTTGALPSGFPRPQLVSYDATLASPERWLLGSVENSTGGCGDLSCYYDGLFWIFIMDRQARIVWYWADPAANASSAYPRVARDGEYLVFDKAGVASLRSGATGVVKMTLDRTYYQTSTINRVNDAIDVTPEGGVLYDNDGDLHEYSKQGTDRLIWSCRKQFPNFSGMLDCYSNTVNWVPADDTVLLSFPYVSTVVEVSRKTGMLVGQYGNAPGSYAFSPAPWKFQFQHSPTITAQGTLLVSTHLPDYAEEAPPGPMHHAFEEFEINRTTKTLTRKWMYSEGAEWPAFKGYNLRLANGNTLVNYGSGGVIREVTADKRNAFQVKFDVPTGDDYDNKLVGNTVLVSDLYSLNGGGPK